MVLSAFVRRTLLATAALGGAGAAALAYAGSHDDEPNPEVRLFFKDERRDERATSSSTTAATGMKTGRRAHFGLSSLPLSGFSSGSLFFLSLPS